MSSLGEEDQVSTWISFTDLMTSLALTFILVMILILLRLQTTSISHAEIKKKVEQAFSINKHISTDLKTEIEKLNLQGQVTVSDTGDLIFKEGVLFDPGSSDIKHEGIDMLDSFINSYFNIILSEKYKDKLESVIIEGHTDPTNNYKYNLKLSQDRAYHVAEYLISPNGRLFSGRTSTNRRDIEKLIAANGKSESFPVYNGENKDICLKDEINGCPWINYDASRRVVFRIAIKPTAYNQDLDTLLRKD